MPHRKNAKSDIGSLKRFSDTYDMDNVYLSEEGWVYRHFKNSERTLWWDEILVAGQVKPGMEIHGVNNNPVVPTNPLKLGTAWDGADGAADDTSKYLVFETGDGHVDHRYSDHVRADEKVTTFADDVTLDIPLASRTDFQETAWSSINVEPTPIEFQPDSTQVPLGWDGVSSPKYDLATDQPPYPGEEYRSINHYTVNPGSLPGPYNSQPQPWQENAEVIVGQFADNTGPAVIDEDYNADAAAFSATPPVTADPKPSEAVDPEPLPPTE